jgi:hypothetical protein
MVLPRTVAAEALDELPPDDPAAQRSRRDLLRVHRAMGTRAITVRGWQALVSAQRAGEPLKVLEIGAGDGTLLLGVARALRPAWPQVDLTLLDRQAIVSAATLQAYAAQGWRARVEQADVLDWAAHSALPSRPAARWDLITSSLFLHHFQGSQLDALLRAIEARCDRFFACEPRRGWLALAGSHGVGALGANAVTRADAVLSVHAGFRDDEIGRLWPGPRTAWRSREAAAGLFSHGFCALRCGLS